MGDRRSSSKAVRRFANVSYNLEISEEQKRKKREAIPRGDYYPGTYQKGQIPRKTSYIAATPVKSADAGSPVTKPDFAEVLIANMPPALSRARRREYWERSLLVAYYHIYDESWSRWAQIIPWLNAPQIKRRSHSYHCEYPWDWMAKQRFLEENGFAWSIDDLEYLIDRYPDRQMDSVEQGIHIVGKAFEEIKMVADALNLPTRRTLVALEQFASGLM